MSDLNASYAVCQRLARRSASNFYFSFLLLPRRNAGPCVRCMRYLRHVDDLGDDDASRQRGTQNGAGRFAIETGRSVADQSDDPILAALADTVAKYNIPHEYLFAVMDGVKMDLSAHRYETFADLEQYCERVASVVGQACIHIWGFRGPQAMELARRCGMAFQLTNILRDLKEDAQRGRVYLPADDLRQFGYSPDDLTCGVTNAGFASLMQFEISRAEEFYAAAPELELVLANDGRRVFRAMTATYRVLLRKNKRDPADIFRRRIRLSGWGKLRIAAGAIICQRRNPSRNVAVGDCFVMSVAGTMPAPSVAIIGGGLAGLAAAVALADRGFKITLFEARRQLGGRATIVSRFRQRRVGRSLPAC